MKNTLTICEFGTAPAQKKLGYQLTGFELSCHEKDLAQLLRFAGDVCAVKGGLLDNGEEIFHVMVKRDEPTSSEISTTVTRAIVKTESNIKQLCSLVNSYDKESGGNGRKVRFEDFQEPLGTITSEFKVKH